MLADGALLRRTLGGDHIAAVKAHPLAGHIADKKLALLNKVGELAEPVTVDLLDAGDLGEEVGDLGEALLLGGVGKGGVVVLVLLVLVVLGGAKMLGHGGVEVDGVGAVNGDILPGKGLQMVIEGFGVGLLLACGEKKHHLDARKTLLFGKAGGEGVAVLGLTLSGEGPEQVFLGLTLGKVNGHGTFLLYMDGKSMPGSWDGYTKRGGGPLTAAPFIFKEEKSQ